MKNQPSILNRTANRVDRTNFFTREGFDKIQKEFENLKISRKEAVMELTRAREMGDLSENAAYKVARSRLSFTDSRIRHLNQLIKSAKIIIPQLSGKVDFGSKVVVEIDGIHKEYSIVGSYETDPNSGKLSGYSPLGKTLMGKKAGETAYFFAPKGKISCRIISVQ